jgi:LEA14-like dessication related protein
MKKLPLLGLIATGTLVLFYFVNKTRSALKLDYYFYSIDLSNLKLSNLEIITKVEIVNPTNTSQVVDGIFATVTLNDGTLVGRIQKNVAQTIIKKDSTIIDVPIKLNPNGVAKVTAYVINNQSVPTLNIEGSITSMGISIPIKQTV